MVKICKTCLLEKDCVEFSKHKKTKDNLQSSCRKCMTEKAVLWKLNNPDKVKVNKKNYYNKHRVKNKESIKKYAYDWRNNNKDKISRYNSEWSFKNKDYQREYRNKNKGYISKYFKDRISKDYIFKVKHNVRNLIKNSFKRACSGKYKKGIETEAILGCTMSYFIDFISNKFTEGMTLENHGDWHFDHIVPLSDAKTKEDIIRLNHYTNFQPLWAIDNLKKSNKKELGL